MKKQFLPTTFLATFLATGASAQQPTLRLAPTPLEIPLTIGPLAGSKDAHKYPEAALGVSYQYNMPGAALTIYVYDGGTKDLADGPDTIPVCQEFEFAKQGVLQSYQKPKLVSENMARLLPPDDQLLIREAVLEFQREQQQMVSFVWITTVAKNFIKLRFSADARLRDELPDARRAILAAFGTAIKPHLAPVDPDADQPGTSIGLDLGSDDDGAAGIMYTMFLSAVADQTPELAPVCGGEFVPTFETELGLYRGLFADAAADDQSKLGKQVAKAEAAGFLEEFVWRELHRESWGGTPPEGLTLAEYAAWKKKYLKRFKRPRFGTVSIDHPRPLALEPESAP